MESAKGWLLDVLIKKAGPSAIRGALLGLGGWIAAKSGILGTFGVAYDSAHQIITLDLNTLNIALVALLPAVGAAAIKILNHHADTATTAILKPQETPK